MIGLFVACQVFTWEERYVGLSIWLHLDCFCLELEARWLQWRDNEISCVYGREHSYSDLSSDKNIWTSLVSMCGRELAAFVLLLFKNFLIHNR